jgi:hypothetical protein
LLEAIAIPTYAVKAAQPVTDLRYDLAPGFIAFTGPSWGTFMT